MAQWIYWGDVTSGKIERIKIDGSGREVIISGLSIPQGIYAHRRDNHLYWVDRGTDKIQRSNLDGTNVIDVVTSGLIDPQGLIVNLDIDKIYWIDGSTDNIKRCNLDGSNIETIVSGLVFGEDLVVDYPNQKIYWTDSGPPLDVIKSSDFDGSNIATLLSGLTNPEGIDLDTVNNKIYFANSDAKQIRKCNLDGSSNTLVLSLTGVPVGIVIDSLNNKMYWVEITPGAIFKANLDGTSKTTLLSSLPNPQQLDLYTEPVISSGNIQLFIHGQDIEVIDMLLFEGGSQLIVENIDLFIYGKGLINDDINFILIYPNFFYNSFPININGKDGVNGQFELFISAILDDNINIDLMTKGINAPSNISCPALNPLASIQISSELIGIYQSRIDALINQLGKNVLLEFDPIKEPCSNCIFDIVGNRSIGIYKIGGPIPFIRGNKCPYCKGIGFLEQKVAQCIKCLIKWNPREIKNYGISVSKYNNVVRLKAFLTDLDSLLRAKTAIIDYDIQNIFKQRVKLIKGPIPVGLREDRYCVSFWELIDI